MSGNGYVSVTIVTYNSGRFIKRCLESVLEQQYPNIEVVVVDNASTDGTVDILEQFADRVGLIVGLQGNGKISQEAAYDQIRQLWASLRDSLRSLKGGPGGAAVRRTERDLSFVTVIVGSGLPTERGRSSHSADVIIDTTPPSVAP